MKREEATKLVESGIAKLNEALQSGRSETLERFLATLARFHDYSFGNAILIWSQKPEAAVAGSMPGERSVVSSKRGSTLFRVNSRHASG